METRLTLRPGMPGTKRLLARHGERLVCVRYLYDDARNRRLKTVELLPVPYYHLVFTLPHELNALAQGNPRALYAMLFAAASAMLLEFGRNPR